MSRLSRKTAVNEVVLQGFTPSLADLANISKRDRKIVELLNLWTNRQITKKALPSRSELNAFIDERYETKYGIDGLSFEYLDELTALFKTELCLTNL